MQYQPTSTGRRFGISVFDAWESGRRLLYYDRGQGIVLTFGTRKEAEEYARPLMGKWSDAGRFQAAHVVELGREERDGG